MGILKDKKDESHKKAKKEDRPTNAEVAMKSMQGLGAFEDDEETKDLTRKAGPGKDKQ